MNQKPPIINKKFNYEQLEKVSSSNGKRYYKTPLGDVESVTTILSKTKDMTKINEWRERIGNDKANKELKQATDLGTLLHQHLELWLKEKERPHGTNLIRKMAENMSNSIIENGLKYVNEIWGIEETLYYPNLYAGTTDLVGLYNNKPCIMDFKNSKKIKKEEWIEDYYLQGCAYVHAHNELFNTSIKDVVVFMVDREYNHKIFHINGNDFDYYSNKWIKRLKKYFK